MNHSAVASTPYDKRVFHGLDGLRGIAALAVLMLHYGSSFGTFQLHGSYLAVDLFFALSGFVLSFSYESRFREGLSCRRFMALRIIRLYPLYFLGLLLGCMSFLLTAGSQERIYDAIDNLPVAFISSLLFLPTWPDGPIGNHFLFPLNMPAWSLFFELVVNLLYVLIARHLSNRLLICIIALAAIALLGTAYIHHGLDTGVYLRDWSGGLARVIFSYFAGVGIYRLWAAGIFEWARLPFWLCGLLLLLIFALEPSRMRGLYDFPVTLIIFPALILAATREPSYRWVPLLSLLGELSYAIYVLHFPVLVVMHMHFYSPDIPTPFWPVTVSAFAGILALAFIAHRYYDVPVRRFLNRQMIK